MILLYSDSGLKEVQLGSIAMAPDEWARVRGLAARLLRSRRRSDAVEAIEQWDFEVREGTNVFADEFHVLWRSVSVERYVEIEEQRGRYAASGVFAAIANAVTEVGPYVRFVAVGIDTKERVAPVGSPNLQITSDVVEGALADAQHLVTSRGAKSGLDRVHTAFHGYLRNVCARAGLPYADDLGVAGLFAHIRKRHPAFAQRGARSEDVEKIVNAMSNVASVLDPLRNRASRAHPNENLLDDAEAMLVINTVRTLLHYLDQRLERASRPR